MPKKTRVYRCIQKLKDTYEYGSALRLLSTFNETIVQTGKSLKASKKRKGEKMRKVYA